MSKYENKELKLLDLKQCSSVADIVEGMSKCSFGARMLGEVTGRISQWIVEKDAPIAIYDGKLDSPLGKLLKEMVRRNWLTEVVSQHNYSLAPTLQDNVIVIGAYCESFEETLSRQIKQVIFINQFGMALPGQISDGYFPNVIFCDPKFAIPAIFASLEEKLNGQKTTIPEFIEEIAQYGGLAAQIHRGAHTLLAMEEDPECKVFLTISGAMTIAKMGLVVCDMIDLGMVDGICTTGALMAHGLVESVGLKHFRYDPNEDDATLAQEKLNRVSDTLEPETNLDHIANIIAKVFDRRDAKKTFSPRIFCQDVGKYLADFYPHERGILKSAYQHNVPVFVPAFHDSELGNDLYLDNQVKKKQGKETIPLNIELDTQHLLDIVTKSPKIGIFTIGGGVPRNFIQNIACLIDLINESQKANLPNPRFSYGCRICPDPMYYGHLSGCTYSEGMSWRKMQIHGHFSEIQADATQVWPFLVKFVMEAKAVA